MRGPGAGGCARIKSAGMPLTHSCRTCTATDSFGLLLKYEDTLRKRGARFGG